MSPAIALLIATVWWDGVPAHCLVDTGSTHSLLSHHAATQIGTKQGPYGTVLFQTPGGTLSGQVFRVSNVGTASLGWDYALPVVVEDGLLPNGGSCLLGADLLRQQPITLDFQRGTMERAA